MVSIINKKNNTTIKPKYTNNKNNENIDTPNKNKKNYNKNFKSTKMKAGRLNQGALKCIT